MEKRRIFNYRPCCYAILLLILGIIFGEAINMARPVYVLIPLFLLCISICIFLMVKRIRKFSYLPIFCLLGILLITGVCHSYRQNINLDHNGEFQATVDSEIIIEDNIAEFYVKDIYANGILHSSRAFVMLETDNVDFNAGDVIILDGKIKFNEYKPFDSYFASSYIKSNYYFSYSTSSKLIQSQEPDLLLGLQLKIKSMFFENLDYKTASICQALILGDKWGIDTQIYDGVKSSGLAHILAVSGLHITALASVLFFLLKKTKLKDYYSLIIVLICLFFYIVLCSFSSSSLRAFIMFFMLGINTIFGTRRDTQSSLSFAGLLILIFRPIALMDVGFLLSMSSVFGIITFHPAIKAFFMRGVDKISPKHRIGKSMSSNIALSLSANFSTYPLVAYYFKGLPVLFVLANLVFVPYMVTVFGLLLVLTFLSLVTNFHGFIVFMQVLLYPFIQFIEWVAILPNSVIAVDISVVGIVSYWIMMICISKYFLVSHITKIQIGLSLIALNIVFLL